MPKLRGSGPADFDHGIEARADLQAVHEDARGVAFAGAQRELAPTALPEPLAHQVPELAAALALLRRLRELDVACLGAQPFPSDGAAKKRALALYKKSMTDTLRRNPTLRYTKIALLLQVISKMVQFRLYELLPSIWDGSALR